jgi:predicted DCC family thiol-disulfide oxidoreductase YuxK
MADETTDPPTGSDAWAPDGLMVFDGVCNFCAGSVRLVLRMDRRQVIRFTAVQSAYGRALCLRHGIDPDDPSTFLFFDRGVPLPASDGMVALLARMPSPWRWLRVLAAVPRAVRDAVYRWIARNRYRLFGRRESCIVPTPALRARFIDDPPA